MLWRSIIGSSPPTRGTPSVGSKYWRCARFIPAHAGNTRDSDMRLARAAVHPRPRGEHVRYLMRVFYLCGSSPPTRGTRGSCSLLPSTRRFIPAHAGNTARSPPPLPASAVHPRPRGEHKPIFLNNIYNSGSSPPTRGTLFRFVPLDVRPRFIPAHAGNTAAHSPPLPASAVHPRPRGEHRRYFSTTYTIPGSSPPTRGTPVLGPVARTIRRFIPAHAGNTCSTLSAGNVPPVHPRPRGEHVAPGSLACSTPGSSPPTRGTHFRYLCVRYCLRFIPAHAGNTRRSFYQSTLWAVHPRPRGEHCGPNVSITRLPGSSPPTRGTLWPQCQYYPPARFIPAHAGNTSASRIRASISSVHPRPRGEHAHQSISDRSHPGSSPPTRGTRPNPGSQAQVQRFIPAHAGNTGAVLFAPFAVPVHPRPRGEHAIKTMAGTWKPGSSPPTRGTQVAAATTGVSGRFIPAHAGNTRACSPSARILSVHPRPRGEHFPGAIPVVINLGSSPPTRGTPATRFALRLLCAVHPRPRGEH